MNSYRENRPGLWDRTRSWLKKSSVPLTGLFLSLAIIAMVSWLYLQYPDFFEELKSYGYPGAFVISVVLNATVIIPVSNMAFIFSLGASPNLIPFFVGLAGGIGAAIGELTGYLAGNSGRRLLAKSRVYARVEGWVQRWGFVAVLLLSIVPFLFDVVGIIAGALRMPVWRFFLACWLGRTISYVIVAYLGHFWFEAFRQWFS